MLSLVAWWCLTVCDPMDCRCQASLSMGILQARILEWVAMLFSRESSQPRDQPRSPAMQADSLPTEPPGKPRGCESWTIKKAEHWRINAFKLQCCKRLLRISWTARRSNQSVRKEINPEYSLEGLILMLKLQYSGYLIWSVNSLEKTLMLGKIEGKRRRGDRGWGG